MLCGVLQVQSLSEEVAALEDENGRLSEVIQADQPHNEELLLHVKELQHVRPSTLRQCCATDLLPDTQTFNISCPCYDAQICLKAKTVIACT